MNIYTQESFQKYERKSARGAHSPKQHEEDGYKSKHKNCYSEQRRAKRDWREE